MSSFMTFNQEIQFLIQKSIFFLPFLVTMTSQIDGVRKMSSCDALILISNNVKHVHIQSRHVS